MTPPAETKKLSWKILVLVFLASQVLSFLLYSNAARGEFLFDDSLFASRSELFSPHSLLTVWAEPYVPHTFTSAIWRPIVISSFALNFISFGPSSLSFHVVNIILNGLVVFLIFLLVLKLFADWRLAALTSLLFAFLPIHTEAVSYIKSRDELLSTAFILLSWLAFLKASASNRLNLAWLFTSVSIFILAMLTRESSIMAPALFLAVHWLKNKSKIVELLRLGLAFVPITAIYFIFRIGVLGQYWRGNDVLYFVINPLKYSSFWPGTWTAFKIAFVYISKTIVPYHFSATYSYNHLPIVTNLFHSPQAMLGLSLLLLLIYLAVSRRLRSTPVVYGAVMFLIPYILISKIFFRGGGEMVEEHWTYWPSLGLSLIFAYLLLKIYAKNVIVFWIGLSLLLGFYGASTIIRNQVWTSLEAFDTALLTDAPDSAQSHLVAADRDLANQQLDLAKQEAALGTAIYQDYPPLLYDRARIEFYEGRPDTARSLLVRAQELTNVAADDKGQTPKGTIIFFGILAIVSAAALIAMRRVQKESKLI
jgi:hypothetical protein